MELCMQKQRWQTESHRWADFQMYTVALLGYFTTLCLLLRSLVLGVLGHDMVIMNDESGGGSCDLAFAYRIFR
jgi:hypothetical protein